MLTGILGGSAVALAIGVVILGWRVISMSRDFADRQGKTHERADKDVGEARRAASAAAAAQRMAEGERDMFRKAADTAVLSLEAARIELGRERRINVERGKRITDLEAAIDASDTPVAVRDRLRRLLSGTPP